MVPRSRMGRRSLVGLLSIVFFSASVMLAVAQEQGAEPSQDEVEFRKLEPILDFLRNRNARDYAITAPDGIDEGRYVEIGGIEQWITIRGLDRDNPVLLFLHGGPGDATNPWGYAGFRSWLEDFTVVQWDQRGAGRTHGRNGPSVGPTITVARMVQDGVELAEYLRETLQKDRIVLVGHSWGSILGGAMVKARPDLFHVFVGTGQVADPTRNYEVAYAELLKEAEKRGNARAIEELREVGPPPYADGRGYGIQRKWSNQFEGADLFLASALGFALTAPGYSLRDVNDWLDGQGLSAERLVPETSVIDAASLGGEFAVPVFVIQGSDDFTTPTSLARAFVESIRAPSKEFLLLEGGGHFAVFTMADAFLEAMSIRVLPLIGSDSRMESSAGSSTQEHDHPHRR